MFKPNVEIAIRRNDAGAGGEETEIATPALLIESEEWEPADRRPALRFRRELLIPPPVLPRPGDLAVCGGEEWVLCGVRVCRDLDGNVVAARCLVEA